jgi:hypothetical protein
MITFHRTSPPGSPIVWYDICDDGMKVGYMNGSQRKGYVAYDLENKPIDQSPKYYTLRRKIVEHFSV